MDELVPFLQKNEQWIYILLGIVALFPLLRLISAWKAWQGSLYGLEREIAQRRFSAALTVLVLLVMFVLGEFVIVSFVAPSYPQVAFLPTGTLDLLATPTFTLAPAVEGVSTEASLQEFSSQTATVGPEGCVPGQIEWEYPKPGQEVSATVELKGTVNVPNLGYYKYEFAKIDDEIWNPLAAGNQPKVNGVIGYWDTSSRPQGDYRLRLVVYDNAQNMLPICIIPVRVGAQP